MVTADLMKFIQGSKIIDFNKVVNSDHRGFIINIDVKDYFSLNSSDYECANIVTLDSTKRSHRNKFKVKLKECVDQLQTEETANNLCNSRITGQEIDRIDDAIAFILNSARKCMEGIERRVPASKAKVHIKSTVLCHKSLKNQ